MSTETSLIFCSTWWTCTVAIFHFTSFVKLTLPLKADNNILPEARFRQIAQQINIKLSLMLNLFNLSAVHNFVVNEANFYSKMEIYLSLQLIR